MASSLSLKALASSSSQQIIQPAAKRPLDSFASEVLELIYDNIEYLQDLYSFISSCKTVYTVIAKRWHRETWLLRRHKPHFFLAVAAGHLRTWANADVQNVRLVAQTIKSHGQGRYCSAKALASLARINVNIPVETLHIYTQEFMRTVPAILRMARHFDKRPSVMLKYSCLYKRVDTKMRDTERAIINFVIYCDLFSLDLAADMYNRLNECVQNPVIRRNFFLYTVSCFRPDIKSSEDAETTGHLTLEGAQDLRDLYILNRTWERSWNTLNTANRIIDQIPDGLPDGFLNQPYNRSRVQSFKRTLASNRGFRTMGILGGTFSNGLEDPRLQEYHQFWLYHWYLEALRDPAHIPVPGPHFSMWGWEMDLMTLLVYGNVLEFIDEEDGAGKAGPQAEEPGYRVRLNWNESDGAAEEFA